MMAEKDIVYRSTVRLGNWYEDLCLEKDEIKQFLEERKKNQLLVQKARALFGNFYKEVLLGVASEHVKFGSVIQLIPTDINICQDIYKFPGQSPALAIVINEKVVKTTQQINNKCEVTLAYMNSPCIRNSFLLNKKDCIVDENMATDVLKYGESFRLQILEADEEPLFIYSAPMNADLSTMVDITYTSSMNGQVNNSVGLCLQREMGPKNLIPSAYTWWKCQHIDPEMRFASIGTPVPSETPVVITHTATNKNLAVDSTVVQTLFGTECVVSCQNYKGSSGLDGWQNRWMIHMGTEKKY